MYGISVAGFKSSASILGDKETCLREAMIVGLLGTCSMLCTRKCNKRSGPYSTHCENDVESSKSETSPKTISQTVR